MSIYQQRLTGLQAKMKEQGIDLFFVTQNVDLYYLNGSMQTGTLVVPKEGTPVYLVRRSVTRAEQESEVEVEPHGSFQTLKERMYNRYSYLFERERLVLAVEFDVLPVQQYMRMQTAFSGAEWKDGSKLIRELRMVKSQDEIKLIRKAAQVVDDALEAVLGNIEEGMPEYTLMALVEKEIRMREHLGLMRMRAYNAELITGCVAAGASAAVPTYFDGPAGGQGLSAASPQSAGHHLIQRGEPILLDLGCCIDGYVIDQTRTAVIGDLPEDLKQAYAFSEEILRSSETMLKPGTIAETLYLNALEQAEKAGLSKHFMGYGPDQVKFLGHGIGLEIDEWPVLARGFRIELQPGMVMAIEPKFTFPGRGVVGIENSYLITEQGFEKLTLSREGLIHL